MLEISASKQLLIKCTPVLELKKAFAFFFFLGGGGSFFTQTVAHNRKPVFELQKREKTLML